MNGYMNLISDPRTILLEMVKMELNIWLIDWIGDTDPRCEAFQNVQKILLRDL